mgnify:CR=1 FL=1
MSQMNVQIVTPDGLVYDHHAAFVSVKTIDGELGILPHHINTIAVLAVDQVKVRRVDDDKHIDWIAVNGGIIEVADNVIPLLPILPNVLEISTLVVQNVPNCELKKRLKKPKISIRLIWNVVLKLLFNAPLTGLMSEIVYNILKNKVEVLSSPYFVE